MVRVGKRLGKYRIVKCLAQGGFARVYCAFDTVSHIHVAIKIPEPGFLSKEAQYDFRREVQISAKLDHLNILPVKDAGVIDDIFVVIYPLGQESLGDRMKRRMSTKTVVSFAEQMLEAVAFAHRHHIMHCDIKPENFILFPDNRVRLADFGIAKISIRTVAASGSGTVGYIAPEQAMGKPSFRSDVFSLGLIIYKMLAGVLPEWPFDWPPPNYDKVKRAVHHDVIAVVQRALSVDSPKRYADATKMLAAFKRVKAKALRARTAKQVRRNGSTTKTADWRTMRHRQFQRQFRRLLDSRYECSHCKGPISEAMQSCPWCGVSIKKWRNETRLSKRCPRCNRGVKSDWRFCAWCYGGKISDSSSMRYDDIRYVRQCKNSKCAGQWLMPFARYCSWCRKRTEKPWSFEGCTAKCPRCHWGVLPDFWDKCPWCSRNLRRP